MDDTQPTARRLAALEAERLEALRACVEAQHGREVAQATPDADLAPPGATLADAARALAATSRRGWKEAAAWQDLARAMLAALPACEFNATAKCGPGTMRLNTHCEADSYRCDKHAPINNYDCQPLAWADAVRALRGTP